jgi:hypothetical protein
MSEAVQVHLSDGLSAYPWYKTAFGTFLTRAAHGIVSVFLRKSSLLGNETVL